MAALTITASSIQIYANTEIEKVQVGQATAIGDLLYKDIDERYKPADADTEAQSRATRVALSSAAAADDWIIALVTGDLKIGSSGLTKAVDYYVSPTAAKVGEKSDVTSGKWSRRVAVAKSTSILSFEFSAQSVEV